MLQKRFTAVLTALALTACMGNLPVRAEETLADLNGDGIVNTEDAAELLAQLADAGAGRAEFTEEETAQMDANGDGNLDATDAALILAYSAAVGSGEFAGNVAEYAARQNAPAIPEAIKSRPEYADAYLALCKRFGTYTYNDNALFDLIYFDDDEVPELLASWGNNYHLYRFKDGEAEYIAGSGEGQYDDDPDFCTAYAPRMAILYYADLICGGLIKRERYQYAYRMNYENGGNMPMVVREVYYYEEMNMNGKPDTEKELATIPDTVTVTTKHAVGVDFEYDYLDFGEAQWLENPVMVVMIPTARMNGQIYEDSTSFPIMFQEGETDRFYEEKNFQPLQGKYTYAEMLEMLS